MEQSLFTFSLDLNLINLLRDFKHCNHQFEKGYIESIYAHLTLYSQQQGAEAFDQYTIKQNELRMRDIVLTTHFRFAAINNLDQLLNKLNCQYPIAKINRNMINSTNIYNIHAIFDNQHNYDKDLYEKLRLVLGIKSKGKLEVNMCSYVAHKLNKGLDLNLHHYLFASKDVQSMKEYTENYSKALEEILTFFTQGIIFTKEIYHQYRDRLLEFKSETAVDEKKLAQLLPDIESKVQAHILCRDFKTQHYLEKLLIGMLGNIIERIRDAAVILLNVLYDGVDWQIRAPFTVKISKVGSKFQINYLIESDGNDDDIVVLVKSFLFMPNCRQNILSIHKPTITLYQTFKERKFLHVQLDLGRFTRCGFFDWKIVKQSKSGNIKSIYKFTDTKTQTKDAKMMTRPVQGRFIVQPSFARDMQAHEIFVDLQDAQQEENGDFIRRGNFKTVNDSLQQYKNRGINCIYLVGALERDNGFQINQFNKQIEYKRPNCSPLAITCRQTPCTMCGGKQAFKDLAKKARDLNIALIIDSLTRVSSSRAHRQYNKLKMQTMDDQGKKISVFGTDGRAIKYEDTTLLNYRKMKTWDIFMNEITEFVDEYGITGLHLDNGQAWPQILKINIDEMYRKDPDGQSAYSNKEIFDGLVVEMDENSGYWGSSQCNKMPNPFIIRLCRRLWMRYPQFLIVSEVWGQMGGFQGREFNILQSGPIPRLFKLPFAVCQFFGQNLTKEGKITQIERRSVNNFKKWYETACEAYPEGSIIIQSTTYYTWPYPALLYKKGTWSAVDLFFMLPDIPMTFIGEPEGKCQIVKASNLSRRGKAHKKEEQDESPLSSQNDNELKKRQSIEKQIEEVKEEEIYKPIKSPTKISNNILAEEKKARMQILQKMDNSIFEGSSISSSSGYGYQNFNVQSRSIERKNSDNDYLSLEKNFSFNFTNSLQNIYMHYEHRRKLRAQYKPLRTGKFISLLAEHQYGWHTHVLTFARYTKKQLAIVVINFNDGPVEGFITANRLKHLFPNFNDSDIVVEIQNWMSPEKQVDGQLNHYFVGEFLNERVTFKLDGFESVIYGIIIHVGNPDKQKIALEHSLSRLKQQLSAPEQMIYSNDAANQLYYLVKNTNKVQEFVNGYAYLLTEAFQKIGIHEQINQLVSRFSTFQNDELTKCKLFAFLNSTLSTINAQQALPEKLQQTITSMKLVQEQNQLSTICIVTPEYGDWTKVGGVGVMTYELSIGLASLGQKIVVVTPWYENKAKDKPDALEKAGFKNVGSLPVEINKEVCQVELYSGVHKGVQVYFLRNAKYFPAAYNEEEGARHVIQQITLFSRATLELLLKNNKADLSLIITNDWFSAFIPAYLRIQRYGENCFNHQVKVFHLIHNLGQGYKGKQTPSHQDGILKEIHELPVEIIIDNEDAVQATLNPSKCAISTCDNWGTVSHSYKFELLKQNSLSYYLSKFPNAFSYPNGLDVKSRKETLQRICDNHKQAKQQIMQKYFNITDFNDSYPLFGYVGRITEQKGIHLILDCIENLIFQNNRKVYFLIGGQCNPKEPYSAKCAEKLKELVTKYPFNVWANPDAFFNDGPLINMGCDFGLMPSKFEPGGIVQHEFFVASTPVIAMKTGGLSDTVQEFDTNSLKGNGLLFEEHNSEQLAAAIQRATKLFKVEANYKKLRENCSTSAIDVSTVSKAYLGEFHRMFNKNYCDPQIVKDQQSKLEGKFTVDDFKPVSFFQKQKGQVFCNDLQIRTKFDKILQIIEATEAKSMVFTYKPKANSFPKSIALIGTFNNWKIKWPLKYDNFSRAWKIYLNLPPGDYIYKYIVDGVWVCNDDEPKETDVYGNINNIVKVV